MRVELPQTTSVSDLVHRRTDPACSWHKPPNGRLTRWWFNRNRGRSCRPCRRWRDEHHALIYWWIATKADLIGKAVWDEIKAHPLPLAGLITGMIGHPFGATQEDIGRAVVSALRREL